MSKKHLRVVAAVIKTGYGKEEKYFVAQRPGPKPGKPQNEVNFKWEFPGGKVDAGETETEALVREIQEEFGAEIAVVRHAATVEHEYNDFSISLSAYICTLKRGQLTLKEHLASRWVTRSEFDSIDFAAADLKLLQYI